MLQGLWRVTACKSQEAGIRSLSRLCAMLPADGGMDGQTDRHSTVQLECQRC